VIDEKALIECLDALYKAIGWVAAGRQARGHRALNEARDYMAQIRLPEPKAEEQA